MLLFTVNFTEFFPPISFFLVSLQPRQKGIFFGFTNCLKKFSKLPQFIVPKFFLLLFTSNFTGFFSPIFFFLVFLLPRLKGIFFWVHLHLQEIFLNYPSLLFQNFFCYCSEPILLLFSPQFFSFWFFCHLVRKVYFFGFSNSLKKFF